LFKTELEGQTAVSLHRIGKAKSICLKNKVHLKSTLNTNVNVDLYVAQIEAIRAKKFMFEQIQ